MTELMETDAPLTGKNGDRLGYAKIAGELADSIAAQPDNGGLVIGIEGAWGSGKTSLVNLVFGRLPDVSTVRFLPWLVGGRDALLEELFATLAEALPDSLSARKYKKLRDNLRIFSKIARGAETGLSFVNSGAARAAGAVGKGLDAAATPSLVKLREEIRDSLQETKQKIIVFIDDLDRLEPQETLEVLRLVKAVADFPNITWLIAFDPETTAGALEKAGMTDGRAFLEKIIQVSFKLPAPEPWDLTSWLAEAAQKIVGDMDGQQAARIEAAAQRIGSFYLNTPRDVVRVLNHFRLHYPPLAGKVDPGDLLFLQIVRVRAPGLLDWIEGYVATLARLHDGASLDEGAARDGAEKLVAALGVEPVRQGLLLGAMRRFLPGISGSPVELAGGWANSDLRVDTAKLKVCQVGAGWATDAIRQSRLASPDHHRLYFAFSQPAGALEDADRKDFLDGLRNAADAADEIFARLIGETRPQGGNMGEVLLQRLAQDRGWLDETTAPTLLSLLADRMDDLLRAGRGDGMGGYWEISLARPLFGTAVKALEEHGGSDEFLEHLFRDGHAVGWLARILRYEIFAHGFHGDRPEPEKDRLLSADGFEAARKGFLGRLGKEPLEKLADSPLFVHILYAWLQGGGEKEVRSWVGQATTGDAELMRFLESIKSWSSSGPFLNMQELKNFLDVEDTRARLGGMDSPEAADLLAILHDPEMPG